MFNVVRCGRRWGKSLMDTLLAGEVALQGYPVGLFGPEYDRLRPVWRMLVDMFGPVIVHKDETQLRMTLIGGGLIECWSWETKGAGRSRRYKRVILDEAGLMPDLINRFFNDIFPTLTDFGGDAWFTATPDLKFPDINTLFEYGQGARARWKSWERPSEENPYLPKWMIDVAREEMTPEQFAQEYLGKPVEPRNAFFSSKVIAAHKAQHVRPPLYEGNIEVLADDALDEERMLTEGKHKHIRFQKDQDRGRWQLWCPIKTHGKDVHPRPDQSRVYVLGVDIAAGNGASNSIITVADAETYEMVGKYECSRVTPDQLARIAVAAALWFGGIAPPLIVPERNGPGETFLDTLLKLEWPNIYRDRPTAKVRDKEKDDYGWRSSQQAKETLLGGYRAALQGTGFINRCARGLDECLRYIYDDHNRVVYVPLGTTGVSDGEVPHGDHVIADALARLGCISTDTMPAPEPKYDHGSRAAEERRRDSPKAHVEDDW